MRGGGPAVLARWTQDGTLVEPELAQAWSTTTQAFEAAVRQVDVFQGEKQSVLPTANFPRFNLA